MIAPEAPYVFGAFGLISFGWGIRALMTGRVPHLGEDYVSRDEDWVEYDLSVGWHFVFALLCAILAIAVS